MGIWIQKNICILLSGKERFGDYHHLPISRRFCRKQAAFHINTPYCGTQVFQGKNSTSKKSAKKWRKIRTNTGSSPQERHNNIQYHTFFYPFRSSCAVFPLKHLCAAVRSVCMECCLFAAESPANRKVTVIIESFLSGKVEYRYFSESKHPLKIIAILLIIYNTFQNVYIW